MGRCSLRIVRTDVVVNSVLSPLIYWDEGIAEGPLNNTLNISRECNGGDDGNEKGMCNEAPNDIDNYNIANGDTTWNGHTYWMTHFIDLD